MNSKSQAPVYLKILAWCCLVLLLINTWLHQHSFYQYWQHWYSQVGLVLYPLAVLSLILLFNYGQLLLKTNINREKPLLLFAIVTYAAPTLGFIGTILGLQQGLTGFAAKTTPEALSAAVNGVVSGLTVSLSSTLLGGALGLLAGLSALIYRHLNMPVPEPACAPQLAAQSMSSQSRPAPPRQATSADHVPEQGQSNSHIETLLKKLLSTAGFAHLPIRREMNINGKATYAISLESAQQAEQLIPAIHQQKQHLGLGNLILKRTDQRPNFLYLQL